MKGAIGNALILNIVITFMIIFFSLLIGSMAYSKAYKTKNFILNEVEKFERIGKQRFNEPLTQDGKDFNQEVNEYLGKLGYIISTTNNSCPEKESYEIYKNSKTGDYTYCIYKREVKLDDDKMFKSKYYYMVLVYMKFDLPVLGNYIKIPITGETKTYSEFK